MPPLRIAAMPVLLVTLTACGLVRAKTPPPVVALEMPPPPARVAVPVQLPEPEDLAASAPSASLPAPSIQRPRESASRMPPDRTPAPAAPPPAAVEPASPAAAPPAVLQTTTDVDSVRQRTDSLLGQAQRDLEFVKPRYASLGSQARAQYDGAQEFIRNAKKAADVKNFMYAQQLAVRAAALAHELVKN
jgi:hypothetical protein